MSSKFFALALILPSLAFAASKPCLDGSCTFQITNATTGVTTGSVFLNGSTSAISDLTEDAGWTVIGCDAQNNSHTVRAICTGSNSTCSHLYNNGANNTIVRLPAGCGKGPFARVVNEWQHENQTVPDHVQNVLTRRDGEPTSTVRGISVDTNWTAVDPSHHGPVSMHVLATTGHDANAAVNADIATRQDQALFDKLKEIAGYVTSPPVNTKGKLANLTQESKRSWWDSIVNDATSAADTVANDVTSVAGDVATFATSAAGTVATAVTSVAGEGASAVNSAAGTVATAVSSAVTTLEQPFDWNNSSSTSFSSGISKQFASGSLPCAGNQYQPSFTVSYDISATVGATGSITYGLVLAGTLLPPNLDQFSMDVGIDTDVTGSISWNGLGGISTSTGWLTLLEVPLSPFTIADVITIGPMLQLNVEATQQVQGNAQLSVNLGFSVSGAKLSIPDGSSAGTFTPMDNKVTFSAAPGVVNSGSVTAHIIPTLLLGLDAFGGKASTSVNINMDASATLDMSLIKGTAGTFTGSAEIDAGLSLNAGASATFFSFLNTYKQYTIASHSWKLWSDTFAGNSRRDHARELPVEKRVGLPDGLSCQWPAVTSLEQVVEQKVSSSDQLHAVLS